MFHSREIKKTLTFIVYNFSEIIYAFFPTKYILKKILNRIVLKYPLFDKTIYFYIYGYVFAIIASQEIIYIYIFVL